MIEPQWDKYPLVAHLPTARAWLQIQADLGHAAHTVDAYGRDLEDYLQLCARLAITPETAKKDQIARYVRDLSQRPNPRRAKVVDCTAGAGLSNATMQRRITVLRLYYDYLIEEAIRTTNPVGRGRYRPGTGFGGQRDRGLIPHYQKLPWIPNEDQWQAIVQAVLQEPIRNRFMFALAYDTAMRREELCTLDSTDLQPGKRLVRIRAEHTKSRKERVVPFSEPTGRLYAAYLQERRTLTRTRGALFLSTANQNKGQPISIWTWSKVVKGIAERAHVEQFTPHTTRHLCLTDLAHAGWDLHEIATFAGHQSIQTTRLYIQLSGRELAEKVGRGMDQIHAWRIQVLAAGCL